MKKQIRINLTNSGTYYILSTSSKEFPYGVFYKGEQIIKFNANHTEETRLVFNNCNGKAAVSYYNLFTDFRLRPAYNKFQDFREQLSNNSGE